MNCSCAPRTCFGNCLSRRTESNNPGLQRRFSLALSNVPLKASSKSWSDFAANNCSQSNFLRFTSRIIFRSYARLQISETRTWNFRPRFFPTCVNGEFEGFLAFLIFAENLRTGVGELCGRTRLSALDFAEGRDLLDFCFAKTLENRLYNSCSSQDCTSWTEEGSRELRLI